MENTGGGYAPLKPNRNRYTADNADAEEDLDYLLDML